MKPLRLVRSTYQPGRTLRIENAPLSPDRIDTVDAGVPGSGISSTRVLASGLPDSSSNTTPSTTAPASPVASSSVARQVFSSRINGSDVGVVWLVQNYRPSRVRRNGNL